MLSSNVICHGRRVMFGKSPATRCTGSGSDIARQWLKSADGTSFAEVAALPPLFAEMAGSLLRCVERAGLWPRQCLVVIVVAIPKMGADCLSSAISRNQADFALACSAANVLDL